MTIDKTYPIFTVLWFGCSRTCGTYHFFLGSISAMQFIQRQT